MIAFWGGRGRARQMKLHLWALFRKRKTSERSRTLNTQKSQICRWSSFVLPFCSFQPAPSLLLGSLHLPVFTPGTSNASFLIWQVGIGPRTLLLALTAMIQSHVAAISYLLQQWFSKKDSWSPIPTVDSVWGHFWLPQLGAGPCWFYWAEKPGMPLSILRFFKKNYLTPNVTWDWGVLMSRNLVVFSLCKNAYVTCMHMRASMYMSTCECRNAHAMRACMHVDSWGWQRMSSRIAFCNDIQSYFSK